MSNTVSQLKIRLTRLQMERTNLRVEAKGLCRSITSCIIPELTEIEEMAIARAANYMDELVVKQGELLRFGLAFLHHVLELLAVQGPTGHILSQGLSGSFIGNFGQLSGLEHADLPRLHALGDVLVFQKLQAPVDIAHAFVYPRG